MILAELSDVPDEHFKWTVIIILAIATFGLLLYTTFRAPKTIVTPDPLRVEKLDKFATRDFVESQNAEVKRRLDAHDRDVQRIYDEIKAERAANQVHQSERSKTLFNEIKSVRDELTDKMDEMPDRIIRLLSELNLLNKPSNHDNTRKRDI
jgi:hypothetical protein